MKLLLLTITAYNGVETPFERPQNTSLTAKRKQHQTAVFYSTIHTIRDNMIQDVTKPCDAIPYNTKLYDTIQYDTPQNDTMQHNTM